MCQLEPSPLTQGRELRIATTGDIGHRFRNDRFDGLVLCLQSERFLKKTVFYASIAQTRVTVSRARMSSG